MKFLKVLSTSAIAAAILASMSATAFASFDEEGEEFDDPGFSFDLNDAGNGDDGDVFDGTGLDDDDDTYEEDEIDFASLDTNKVNDAQAPASTASTPSTTTAASSVFDIDNEDDDGDSFADAEEEDDETYTTTDADFLTGGSVYGNYAYTGNYNKSYSWYNWDYSTNYWETTEYAPAGVKANATVFDVVEAAKAAYVGSLNVQSLSNFLILNEENFTSDDYAAFIATINAIKEEIIEDHAREIFGADVTATGMEDADRARIYASLNRSEKDAISAAIINTANAHRVLISYDTDDNGLPLIYASMRHRIADTPVSSGSATTTTAAAATSNTNVASGTPVAATGGELPETGSTGAAAFASIALGLACIGAVIVARKNRA